MKVGTSIALVGALAGFSLAGASTPPARRARILATINLPSHVAGNRLGGISGLDFDRRRGVWLLISDDKSEHAAARIYSLRLSFSAGSGLRLHAISAVTLRDAGGRAFPPQGTGKEAVDGESIRLTLDGRHVLWSSEGDPRDGFGPALRMADRGGRTRSTVPLPEPVRSDGRPNKTIEGLSYVPDGTLWASMEAPLLHDGPPAGVGRPAIVRFIRFQAGKPQGQFGYPIDPIVRRQPDRLADNGVSEILAIRQDRLLVLERSGEQKKDGGFTFHCRLYLADFHEARDVTALRLHDGMAGIATKRLLIDFDRLMPKSSGNLEAIGWWPGHRGRWLLMANDNNFADAAASRLLLVALPEDPALR